MPLCSVYVIKSKTAQCLQKPHPHKPQKQKRNQLTTQAHQHFVTADIDIPYPWTVSQICRQDIARNHECELFCRTTKKQFLHSRCSGQGSVNVPWFQSWFFNVPCNQDGVTDPWFWSECCQCTLVVIRIVSMYFGSKQRVSVYFGSDQDHVNELWFQSGVSRLGDVSVLWFRPDLSQHTLVLTRMHQYTFVRSGWCQCTLVLVRK